MTTGIQKLLLSTAHVPGDALFQTERMDKMFNGRLVYYCYIACYYLS
jgi:hypothetical protein